MEKFCLEPGKTYIRIAPCGEAPWDDYSYTTTPLIFKGRNTNNDLIFVHSPETWEGRLRCDEDIILDEEWDDGNWIPFDKMEEMPETALSAHKGKLIVRCNSADYGVFKDSSFMDEAQRLMYATKYHVVLYDPDIKEPYILNCKFANPDDWRVL